MSLILVHFSYEKELFPLDVMHHMGHKMPGTLKASILNIYNTISSSGKNSPIATLIPMGKCEQIQEVKWSELTQESDLLKKPLVIALDTWHS